MKNAKIGAKMDKITEKRHFTMDFFVELLIIQFHQYTNRLQSYKIEHIKKNGQKMQFPPYSWMCIRVFDFVPDGPHFPKIWQIPEDLAGFRKRHVGIQSFQGKIVSFRNPSFRHIPKIRPESGMGIT